MLSLFYNAYQCFAAGALAADDTAISHGKNRA